MSTEKDCARYETTNVEGIVFVSTAQAIWICIWGTVAVEQIRDTFVHMNPKSKEQIHQSKALEQLFPNDRWHFGASNIQATFVWKICKLNKNWRKAKGGGKRDHPPNWLGGPFDPKLLLGAGSRAHITCAMHAHHVVRMQIFGPHHGI